VAYSSLSKLALTPSAKPRIDMLLEAIVERASDLNPVDLDVVSLIFQQEPVRWEQLETVISSCPQASDVVVHHFLQTDQPDVLASEHGILLARAASPKYAEEFAIFLDKIYQKDKKVLSELFLSLGDKCTTLHYDFLETIGKFITELCNFGGAEGVRILADRDAQHLQAAVEMLKVVDKLPEGAELPNEDLFIDWFLGNNNYEAITLNPAHKSPAHHLMRQLVDQVHQLLKTSTPSKVLSKYAAILSTIKHSKRLPLAKRHLLFNQLHYGASSLLSSTLTPGLLADVLVGGEQPLLSVIINDLKANLVKKSSKAGGKWAPEREVDITDKFEPRDLPEIKDIQVGKGGSKSPAFKIPITKKSIQLATEAAQFPTKFIIGFCLNDHADNKSAILPSRVELYGGNDKALLKIGDLTPIEDQFYLSCGVRLFAINLHSRRHSLGSVKKVEFRLH
jgi:hypothetical protein